jgi:lysophospholipase L1-like esterase
VEPIFQPVDVVVMTVRLLMIGDCTLATSYLPPRYKNEQLLAERLRELYPNDRCELVNEGLDGESVGKFLKRYDRTLRRYAPPDYVLIRYGVNDRREYGVDGFRAALTELCERLRADLPRARVLLETGVYVDYPDHYEFDRNTVLQPIYQTIRELGQRYELPVVDVYERMKRETEQGNWDLRVRGYGVVDEDIPVLGAGQDHLHEGDVRWWTNIHPNPSGIAVIADEEAQVLKRHWPDTLHV